MTSPQSPEIPAQLNGFPEEVRDAYLRFRQTGEPGAAQEVVLAALKDFLPPASPVAEADRLQDPLRLVEDLGLDSVAVAEVVFFIEDLFHITLQNQDLKRIRTVGELRQFVADKIQSGVAQM